MPCHVRERFVVLITYVLLGVVSFPGCHSDPRCSSVDAEQLEEEMVDASIILGSGFDGESVSISMNDSLSRSFVLESKPTRSTMIVIVYDTNESAVYFLDLDVMAGEKCYCEDVDTVWISMDDDEEDRVAIDWLQGLQDGTPHSMVSQTGEELYIQYITHARPGTEENRIVY